jgi:mannose-6-phosphate isomerase-like protein (cupin superfamily)
MPEMHRHAQTGGVRRALEVALFVDKPSRIQAAGNKPKTIEEFVGRANTGTASVSIARMRSPAGWVEPGQRPDFDEYTVVLDGAVHVKLEDREFDVAAGEAVLIGKGEWVQYSTPLAAGASYISVCLPAFSPETVHRDR